MSDKMKQSSVLEFYWRLFPVMPYATKGMWSRTQVCRCVYWFENNACTSMYQPNHILLLLDAGVNLNRCLERCIQLSNNIFPENVVH